MLLSELRSPFNNSPLLCWLRVPFSWDLTHSPKFTTVSLRSPKSMPFSDYGGSRGCHRMTSDSLAGTTVTRRIISQKFSEPGMRWIVQITISTQVALSWGNPLLIKRPLLKAYRPSCQKQPDVSRQHQFMTSLRILTWTKYRWAGVVAICESPFRYSLYIVCTSVCILWSYCLFGVMPSFKHTCSIGMFWARINKLWNIYNLISLPLLHGFYLRIDRKLSL